MKAIYIKGKNPQGEFETILKGSYPDVYTSVSILDAIGLIRSHGIENAFLDAQVLDMSLIQAINVLAKLDEVHLYVVSNEAKPDHITQAEWIQLPIGRSELAKLLEVEELDDSDPKVKPFLRLAHVIALSNGDNNFVEDILNTFSSDVPTCLENIRLAYEEKHVEKMGMAAHKLKAPFNLLGIDEVDDELRFLDDLYINKEQAVNLPWTEITSIIQKVLSVGEQVLEEVANYKNNY